MQIPTAIRSAALALIAAAGLLRAQAPTAKADLVLVNARVYTVDDSRPNASAFAVRNGRIVFVGSDREARFLAGPRTRVIDAHGRTVIPGMVDAHAHLLGLGTSLRNVQLAGSKSYDEVIARVVARAKTAKPGEWIQGEPAQACVLRLDRARRHELHGDAVARGGGAVVLEDRRPAQLRAPLDGDQRGDDGAPEAGGGGFADARAVAADVI